MKIVSVIFFIFASAVLYADLIDDALVAHRNGNYEQAIQNYMQACNNGNAKGCLGIGSLYFLGQGVKKDIKTAQNYFEKGCKAGNKRACYNYKACSTLKYKTH